MRRIFISMLFLLFLVIATSSSSNASSLKRTDTSKISIHIVASSAFITSKSFWIDIYKAKGSIKIVYSLEDSVAFKSLRKDMEYISADGLYNKMLHMDTMFKTWNTKKKDSLSEKVYNLYLKYTIRRQDSVAFKLKNNIKYARLLDTIANADKAEIENTEVNKNRAVLDGTQFEITIISNSVRKKAFVNTPNFKSYPLFYKFLEETLSIYRHQKNNYFLDERSMHGY
jgi:hypothetical protein